jgi:hypoxanthine phosphoribosyltransferase
MKEYFDLKRNTKPADLKVGDIVLMKQEKKNKLSTPFNPEPMTIKNKKGSMITAAAENKEITRNSSFFKKIGKPVLCDDEIDDILESGKSIRVITKLPNSEQSSKGKVKTHKYINRQNPSTTEKL